MTKPRFTAKTRVTTLDAGVCRPPLDVFRELSGPGAVLMESAAQGSPGGTRSLVVPGGVVRLTVRGDDVRFEALTEAGARLLPALSPPSRIATVDRLPLADHERLQSPSVLDAVRTLAGLVEDDEPGAALPPGVYGAFAYELVDSWEELPPRAPSPADEPDINVVLALDTVLFDHVAGHVHVVTRSLAPADEAAADERHRRFVDALTSPNTASREDVMLPSVDDKVALADVSDEDYLASVGSFLDYIGRGDIFQGVLSRGLEMTSDADPLAVYRVLRQQNPSPYMFHVDLGDGVLLGASPETCVKVEGRRIDIRPIAGTAPRGFAEDGTIDTELDSRLAIALLLDAKEQAEHAMLVDLARNDVARVAIPGTRRVAEPFTIEKYSHVQHLVSGVSGELRPELDALHAYRAAANMGTLTGAPKLRAMELIREAEPFARGFYGGAVGYLLRDGTFDSCIVIRSLRYHPGGRYTTRAGAGIVADSVPERELAETNHKARACRQAVADRRGVRMNDKRRVLVLDNRDSFVFNLVDEFASRGATTRTLRSSIALAALEDELAAFAPHLVVLSPGPGRPEDAGVMVEWLETEPAVPVLGICLGHQALAVAAGGVVARAPRPVHGQASTIDVDADEPLFAGLDTGFAAARYHSLVVTEVPDTMRVIASTRDGGDTLVMALRHRRFHRLGLQFHPESILTPAGRKLLWRFFDEANGKTNDGL